MISQREPRIGRNPCVAVTTKQFNKASGKRVLIELRTLRKGQFMMVTAGAGEVVELKIVVIPTDAARATQLLLKVTDDMACPKSALTGHGTSANATEGTPTMP